MWLLVFCKKEGKDRQRAYRVGKDTGGPKAEPAPESTMIDGIRERSWGI